jgi:hypothetical protein
MSLWLTAAPARAQEAPPPGTVGEEEAGRPFDGYFVASLFVGLTLFIVAKSARR